MNRFNGTTDKRRFQRVLYLSNFTTPYSLFGLSSRLLEVNLRVTRLLLLTFSIICNHVGH